LKFETDLVKFVEAKALSLKKLKQRRDFKPYQGLRPGFGEALRNAQKARGLGFMAEYKRASPSLGDINLQFGPLEVADHYKRADCISVLTEEVFFKGDIGYLSKINISGKPLLRKDFIFDPLQVLETAQTPASAMLLMVRLTPDQVLLKELMAAAEENGLEALVEVFDLRELDLARRVGAQLIQFNSRDLNSLKVDTKKIFELAKIEPPQDREFYLAASGLSSPEDLLLAAQSGFGAVLIGTKLMKSANPGQTLENLIDGFERAR
jgi:indole-3-glycerol phosphate synthase